MKQISFSVMEQNIKELLLAGYVKKLNQQVVSTVEYINRIESLKQSSDIKL